MADDGRLFRTRTGEGFSGSTISKVWKAARAFALNAGVHAPEAAERAGHGVDVLLKVYAKCIDGQREVANGRILEALSQ